MRILYSVQGDGKGHAIRSSVTIAWLKKQGHKVLITASNDAFPILKQKFGHVIQIEGARMVYGQDSMLLGKTVSEFLKNFGKRNRRNFEVFYPACTRFKPELIISDMEPIAYYFSKMFNVPLISIDNNNFIARCKLLPIPEKDKNMFFATKLLFGLWTPGADYYVISTFIKHKAKAENVIFVPPILRDNILDYKPKDNGHVLIYQTSDKSKHFLDMLKKFDRKFIIYGLNMDKQDKNLTFRKFNEVQFFKDVGDATAVIQNGGYTLMGEAIYLHKPILSVPIKHQVEQIYNAVCLEKLGYGMFLKSFSYNGVKKFLDNLETYRKNLQAYKQDGNNELFKLVSKLIDKYKKQKHTYVWEIADTLKSQFEID
jgi:uncharacterized protein (TIGR00661 family)